MNRFAHWPVLVALLATGALSAFAAAPFKPPDEASFTVTPAAPGRQLVRASLPFVPGFLADDHALRFTAGEREVRPAIRPLSWYPASGAGIRSVRRALVTFPFDFPTRAPVRFHARPAADSPADSPRRWPVEVRCEGSRLTVEYRRGPRVEARWIGPSPEAPEAPPRIELVESNACFLWRRFEFPDPRWPRVVEVREDLLGGVTVVAHVQRRLEGDGRAPDLGWEFVLPGTDARWAGDSAFQSVVSATGSTAHSFSNGTPAAVTFAGDRFRLEHPAAPLKRRGEAVLDPPTADGRTPYRYWRCRAAERVPMQSMAWQRLEFSLAPSGLAPLTASLRSPHEISVEPGAWASAYDLEPAPESLREPRLAALLAYHRDAIVRSMAVGDDWGNVTAFNAGQDTGPVGGMNRLNHCPPIFADAWRSGDARLREVALLWCDNFHDQTIWWGPKETGGTRYNNIRAQNQTPPDDDRAYMWRSNGSVNFCTKGYDSFFLAYEETGDPRFHSALDAQLAYARVHLHADRGECRNIGDVRDFAQLHRWTGDPRHHDEALRLFRELRTKLSTGDLFDQGGKPLAADPPFIEEDNAGLKVGYAKPYIIGYALAGLPELARLDPAEPRLTNVIAAVADFLATSQDPLGAWRYPHPRSSWMILSQAIEHAWQLVQADRYLGPREAHLDAIERVLRQRLHGWERTGTILAGLGGWELATGRATNAAGIYALYARPADRDFTRDYGEGRADAGSSSPEGLVYLPEVLAFYLQHRPVERLLAPPREDEPLAQVLRRLPGRNRSQSTP